MARFSRMFAPRSTASGGDSRRLRLSGSAGRLVGLGAQRCVCVGLVPRCEDRLVAAAQLGDVLRRQDDGAGALFIGALADECDRAPFAREASQAEVVDLFPVQGWAGFPAAALQVSPATPFPNSASDPDRASGD